MGRQHLSFSTYEGSIIWRFFDGVSMAVSSRMLRGSVPGEENLTFLLCELLDEGFTGLHVLEYPLANAKADLEKSDAGLTVDVEFRTHEHPRHVESKYSGADLGVVFIVNHPVLGNSRRAVLVQAKKLFGAKRSKEFSLYSEYASYDKDQAAFLQELQQRFEAWNSVFYLWYNPPSSGFSEQDAKLIKSYEVHSGSLWPLWGRIHPFLDEIIESGLPFLANMRSSIAAPVRQEEEEMDRAWRARQPAIRVSALDAVLAITGAGQQPQLRVLYKSLLENGARRLDRFVFAPFADFFLLGLLSGRIGSSDDRWVQLAEGQRIPMPPLKQNTSTRPPLMLDQFENPPTPRHTITFTVRSTLPNVG